MGDNVKQLTKGAGLRETKYVELEEVCGIRKGIQFNRRDMQKEGSYPVINGGVEPSGYAEKHNCDAGTITIAQGGSAGDVKWMDVPFWAGAHCYVLDPSERIDARYLYHFLKSKERDLKDAKYGAGIPSLAKRTVEELPVPLPPLETQREIVRILDKFSAYEAGLQAELRAELRARREQYEWYRDWLIGNAEGTVEAELGEVCDITSGGDKPTGYISAVKTKAYSVPIISNGTGKNGIYGFTDKPSINKPSVTVAARGTIGYAEYRDYPYFPIIRILTASPKDTNLINAKYLYYCLQGREYSIPKAGIPQLTIPMLSIIKIPLPPLSVQHYIVSVLDRFDTLTNSLTQGLPAEIKAVHEQYEYYRDLLLSFPDAA